MNNTKLSIIVDKLINMFEDYNNVVGRGTTSVVFIKDKYTVKKKFNSNFDYHKERTIMFHINYINDYLFNCIKMLTFNNSEKTIDYVYIPYNLEQILLNSNYYKLSNEQTYNIIISIIKSLESLHNNYIIHGDFKSKNIQLTENLEPYIIDFGLSRKDEKKELFDILKKDDIDKLWYIIIQLILKIDYRKSYKEIKNNLTKIEVNHSVLCGIYNKRKYDINSIKKYFISLL